MADGEMVSVRGRIVPGMQAASGGSRRPKRGTIALQLPFFRAAIPEFDAFFDRPPRIGTLNIAFRGREIRVLAPDHHLKAIRWEHRAAPENFYLSPCRLRFAGRDYRGLLYIPDPATKPGGLPTGHVVEILTERVPMIRYGAPVTLRFDAGAIRLVPAARRSIPKTRRR